MKSNAFLSFSVTFGHLGWACCLVFINKNKYIFLAAVNIKSEMNKPQAEGSRKGQ